MSENDENVRHLLRAAVAQAPAYDAGRLERALVATVPPRPTTERRRRALPWLAAAVVLAIGVGSVGWWAASRDDRGQSQASCASLLDFAGRGYVADGALLNLPRAGGRLGVGTRPGCDDGGGTVSAEKVAVDRIPGVDPGTAVLTDGVVWVSDDLTHPPASVVAMNTRVVCRPSGGSTLGGEVIGYHGPVITSAISPPYALDVVVDRGDAVRLDRYAEVTVRLRVTDRTSGATDADALRRSLSEQSRVTATVQCRGDRFEALDLR